MEDKWEKVLKKEINELKKFVSEDPHSTKTMYQHGFVKRYVYSLYLEENITLANWIYLNNCIDNIVFK